MSDYVTPGRPRPAPKREQGDKFIWDNYGGRLLLVEPKRFAEAVNTQHGPRDVVNANITVIDTGERFHDSGIFPYYLVDQLKDYINGKVLGRLAKQPIEGSDKLAWVLLPASEQDIALAKHFEQTGQVQHYAANAVAQQPQPAAYGSPQGQYPQQAAQAPPPGYQAPQPTYPAQQPQQGAYLGETPAQQRQRIEESGWGQQAPPQQPQAAPPWGGQ